MGQFLGLAVHPLRDEVIIIFKIFDFQFLLLLYHLLSLIAYLYFILIQ